METLIAFLGHQPFLVLFIVIATGYAVGSINIRGFSLGVGAVLFSGLLIGALAPMAQPPAMVGTLGLVMFLYGLGVQFGRQFFEGLRGTAGRKYNALAGLALAAAAATTIVELTVMNVSRPLMAGLFAGAGTNAAAMQAAMEMAGNSQPAVGYSLAYPFGLVGAILCMYCMQLVVRPNVEAVSRSGLETIEVEVGSAQAIGRTLGDTIARLPDGVRVLTIRAGGENRHPDPAMVLAAGDALFLGGYDKATLGAARQMLGEHAPGRIVGDRSEIDYLRVFVSTPQLAGVRLSDVQFPTGVQATVTHVQRGDTEMLAAPGITFELGDRVGLLTHRANFNRLRRFFGNSIRGTADFSYISLGIGITLGVIVGLVPFPVPVLGSLKLGIAGGTLIVALVLGRLERTGALTWTMPLTANITLRNFGLSVFLAQVGMSSGAPFVSAVANGGLALLVAGAFILLALALIPLLIGHYVMRVPFDDLLGVTAGVTGTPAILAYAFRAYPSDRVEVCYAMVYPAATIAKIVIAQLIIAAGPL